MTDWTALRHAYGPANDIPSLLARLSPNADDPVWDALWSRLCHQGTVYSASYEALPALASIAARWKPSERDSLLGLAGAIAISDDRFDITGDPLGAHDATLETLRTLASESLAAGGWSTEQFVYLLQAALALRGDRVWGSRLDLLANGEARATCPSCKTELFVVVGKYGHFVAAEEWIERPHVRRVPIVRADAALTEPGGWLVQEAVAANQSNVADWLGYLFGTSRCASCERPLSIAPMIEDA